MVGSNLNKETKWSTNLVKRLRKWCCFTNCKSTGGKFACFLRKKITCEHRRLAATGNARYKDVQNLNSTRQPHILYIKLYKKDNAITGWHIHPAYDYLSRASSDSASCRCDASSIENDRCQSTVNIQLKRWVHGTHHWRPSFSEGILKSSDITYTTQRRMVVKQDKSACFRVYQ